MKVMKDEQVMVKIWEEAKKQIRILNGYKDGEKGQAGVLGLYRLHGFIWGILVSADVLDMKGNIIKRRKK